MANRTANRTKSATVINPISTRLVSTKPVSTLVPTKLVSTKSVSTKPAAAFPQGRGENAVEIRVGANLTPDGRNLGNVLLLNAYEELLAALTHSIPVPRLYAMLGWDDSEDDKRLKAAIANLASTSVRFNMLKNGKSSWHAMAMISYGEIKEGVCSYRYAQFLAEHLCKPDICTAMLENNGA
jgi:hypothetical protein